MIKRLPVILLFAVSISTLFAQPANDDCGNAIEFTDSDGGCISFNTTGFTNDLFSGDCPELGEPGYPADKNIWFSFVAQETDIDISASGGSNDIFVTLIEFDPDPCDFASATQIGCGSANGGNVAISAENLIIGNTYYIIARVGNNEETPGTICISIPVPIPTLGQWGLFVLGIVFLTFGVVKLKSKKTFSNIKVLE